MNTACLARYDPHATGPCELRPGFSSRMRRPQSQRRLQVFALRPKHPAYQFRPLGPKCA